MARFTNARSPQTATCSRCSSHALAVFVVRRSDSRSGGNNMSSLGEARTREGKRDSKRLTMSIGIGIALGASVGAALGAAFDQLGAAIPLGVAIGIAIGSAFGAKKSN